MGENFNAAEAYRAYRMWRRKEEKKKIRRRRLKMTAAAIIVLLTSFAVITAGLHIFSKSGSDYPMPDIDVQLIEPYVTARRGTALKKVRGIVVHYTGNPGSTAQGNRDYFNTEGSEVCSHFVIGLNGEIIQCVPLDEISAASNDRNYDTVSIEVCHPDESGQFTDEAYSSLVQLTVWLCGKYNLGAKDIIRHYDVTGKLCPLYYAENPGEWDKFLDDVKAELNQAKT